MASSLIEASQPVDPSAIQAYSPNYEPSLSRIQSLDILKGIAVLLGMLVSIYYWGGFSDGMQNALIGNPTGTRYRVFAAISLLLQSKMTALISLAFGAGIVLYFVRPHIGSSMSNNDLYVRRNMWLILFGIFNAIILMWQMDIVFHLGIMGLLLFPFPRMAAKYLLITAILLLAINSGKQYWNYHDDTKAYSKFLVADSVSKKIKVKDSIAKQQDSIAKLALAPNDSVGRKAIDKQRDSLKKKAGDTLTKKQQQEIQSWEGIAKKFKWEKKNDSSKIKALQVVSYSKIWDSQLRDTQGRQAAWFYRMGIWEFGSIMLLGMWLFKLGFFNGRFSINQYLLLAVIGVGLGLLCGWFRIYFHNSAILDYTKYVQKTPIPHTILWPFERAFMAVGYASIVMLALQKGFMRGVLNMFSDVGKMALSNYLLQAMLCSIIFYGYGMGYYARIGQSGLYFLAVEIIVVNIVFSTVWLKYFYMGPAEWLLKSLTYKKKVPFIRRSEENTSGVAVQTII
ncbi:MAG TPA: DUF418 domain-containing protein [Chitinophagaceae bacterium]|nr:DUF418 domain-containing protein [Chitinophagaceae bacterium]